MLLYFQNYLNEYTLIGEPNTLEEAYAMIYQFCSDRRFRIYYMRTWIDNGVLVFDAGSHTEFFYLKNVDGTPIELPT